jgi:hypothetical protein
MSHLCRTKTQGGDVVGLLHQDPFIPAKVIQLSLKVRHTQTHVYRQVKYFNAFSDTFHFTSFMKDHTSFKNCHLGLEFTIHKTAYGNYL